MTIPELSKIASSSAASSWSANTSPIFYRKQIAGSGVERFKDVIWNYNAIRVQLLRDLRKEALHALVHFGDARLLATTAFKDVQQPAKERVLRKANGLAIRKAERTSDLSSHVLSLLLLIRT